MIIVTYFFLLRPGEYIGSKSNSTPFRLKDVAFSCRKRVFTETAMETNIQATTFVTIAFTTQNNVVRGEKLGHKDYGDSLMYPKSALRWRVLHLRANNVSPSTPLARIMTPIGRWENITPTMISKTLKTTINLCGPNLGFEDNDVYV